MQQRHLLAASVVATWSCAVCLSLWAPTSSMDGSSPSGSFERTAFHIPCASPYTEVTSFLGEMLSPAIGTACVHELSSLDCRDLGVSPHPHPSFKISSTQTLI